MKRAKFAWLAVALLLALLSVGVWFYHANTLRTPTLRETFVDWDYMMTQFKKDVGRYPTTEEGLRALFERPQDLGEKWHGPYFVGEYASLRDNWGRPYGYRSPGRHNPNGYDLFSYGPDGIESADDIGNW